MRRRYLLKAAPALMAPALAHAEARPLGYIPNAGLSTIDPIWTTALVAAIHGYTVFDRCTASTPWARRLRRCARDRMYRPMG
jgi:peptide/nickel transport system substrate-binding protein